MSRDCNEECGREEFVKDNNFRKSAITTFGALLSTHKVSKMDCPSEKRMIRMALTGFDNIQSLTFDSSSRTLKFIPQGETKPINSKRETLGLGASRKMPTKPRKSALYGYSWRSTA